MKIEILSDTIANNRVALTGEIMDINPKDGRFLMALGKAAEVVEVVEEFETEEVISDEVRVRRRGRKP